MTRLGSNSPPVLGVDFGNVIVRPGLKAGESMFSAAYLYAPPSDDCFDILGLLNGSRRFDGRVYVVSKAGERIERRTREWMEHHDFYARTGIPADRLHFVRSIEEKPDTCRELGITDFVDDRLEVLELMPWMVGRYLYCPTRPEHLPRRITWVATWRELNSRLARVTNR